MSKPKRHHYVPRSYLKKFASGTNKDNIIVIDKTKKETFETNIKNIASENKFYTVESEEDPLYWEYFYSSNIESEIPKLLGDVISLTNVSNHLSVVLTKDIKYELAKLMCSQLTRTRKARDYFYEIGSREKNKLFDNILKLHPIALDQEKLDLLQNFKFDEEFFKSIALPAMNDPDRIERFIEVLMDKIWVIYKNKNHRVFPFATSDHPVIMYDTLSGSIDMSDNGLAKQSTIILYPLSRDVLVALYPSNIWFSVMIEYNDKMFVLEDSTMVMNINRLQYEQCNRQMYYSIWKANK